MQRLDRHLIQRILLIYLIILVVVTLSATLSQAARLTDEVLENGMGLQQFGLLLLTIMPKMAELVTPLAFGIAVVLACVQRNEARTTLLMRAAGRSPAQDTLLVAGLAFVAALVFGAISSTLVPVNQTTYRALFSQAQQQGLEQFDLPLGQPFAINDRLTIQVQDHPADGAFSGVTIVEQRPESGQTRILRAERATLEMDGNGMAQLTLREGSLVQLGPTGDVQQSLSFKQSTLPFALPQPSVLRAIDRVDTKGSLSLWAQRTDQAAAEELIRRLAVVLSVFCFANLAAGVLFARSPEPSGQTPLAIFLVAFLIVFLLLQTTLLSAPGFSLLTAVIVLLIALSPLSVLPIIRIGQRAFA